MNNCENACLFFLQASNLHALQKGFTLINAFNCSFIMLRATIVFQFYFSSFFYCTFSSILHANLLIIKILPMKLTLSNLKKSKFFLPVIAAALILCICVVSYIFWKDKPQPDKESIKKAANVSKIKIQDINGALEDESKDPEKPVTMEEPVEVSSDELTGQVKIYEPLFNSAKTLYDSLSYSKMKSMVLNPENRKQILFLAAHGIIGFTASYYLSLYGIPITLLSLYCHARFFGLSK